MNSAESGYIERLISEQAQEEPSLGLTWKKDVKNTASVFQHLYHL